MNLRLHRGLIYVDLFCSCTITYAQSQVYIYKAFPVTTNLVKVAKGGKKNALIARDDRRFIVLQLKTKNQCDSFLFSSSGNDNVYLS